MIEYPKIETLYDRQPDFSVDPTRVRIPAWLNVRWWEFSEKIDGTNVRIGLHPDGQVEFSGRTDKSQLPSALVAYLRRTFTDQAMTECFADRGDNEVIVFGEGYGPGIQNGQRYRADVAVRIFDVKVGEWWLETAAVTDIAYKLRVFTVPLLGHSETLPTTEEELLAIELGRSVAAREDSEYSTMAEGIVARASPMLLTRDGARCIWKLKHSDFHSGKR